LTLAEYHEQEEIFKLRLGHLKKWTMQLVEMEDNGLSASLLNSGEYRALVLGELIPKYS
ncbi:hypothetical protein Celaphus_00015777, partial [Cervus elaphus hippelaphus]